MLGIQACYGTGLTSILATGNNIEELTKNFKKHAFMCRNYKSIIRALDKVEDSSCVETKLKKDKIELAEGSYDGSVRMNSPVYYLKQVKKVWE